VQQLQGPPGGIRAFACFISRNLYQKPRFAAAFAQGGRYWPDGVCGAWDLRNLLSVAAKLRLLAAETRAKGDQLLYLMTAEALEKRADRLAATLPNEHHDQDVEDDAPWRHRPVDLIV
jgi:hypothetical protein